MTVNRTLQRSLAVAGAGALLLLGVPLAEAASFGTPAVAYTAGGIADANGTYFAKSGSTLTLTVNTDDKARCVAVAGLPSFQTSTTAKTTWTFPGIPTAPATTADGVQSRLVTIGEANNNNGCTTKPSTSTASYVLDNTGPSVSASLNPQPNTAGWNPGTVVVSWIAGDRGGVGGGTVTGNTTVSTDTAGQTVTGIAADALGNVGLASSVVVRRDTVKPAISGQRAPAANGFGWNNTDVTVSFTCSDALSQIASCVAEGTSGRRERSAPTAPASR